MPPGTVPCESFPAMKMMQICRTIRLGRIQFELLNIQDVSQDFGC